MTARLYVVGTPIGNLGDWSDRAREIMAEVDLIACEDTRRTGLLLSRFGLENPGMVVMNEHTERHAVERVNEVLDAGGSVAVATDAGMPTISDPGAYLVEQVVAAGHEVSVVPGPTAASAALSLSGFTTSQWVFEGFLPRKGSARARRVSALGDERRVIVLYEAPHRVERTLEELAEVLDPTRRCVVARELTKLHEEVWRGQLGDAAAAFADARGELVIVIDAATEAPEASDEELLIALQERLATGASTRDAADEVAAEFAVRRRRAYDLAISLR